MMPLRLNLPPNVQPPKRSTHIDILPQMPSEPQLDDIKYARELKDEYLKTHKQMNWKKLQNTEEEVAINTGIIFVADIFVIVAVVIIVSVVIIIDAVIIAAVIIIAVVVITAAVVVVVVADIAVTGLAAIATVFIIIVIIIAIFVVLIINIICDSFRGHN
ncbi:hypothetical protein INT47_005529 [Mucor saturninus]|uniref:Uncharacterized protein n=1 Tax=Mucor saturninus TaxID=64648 RepID=A0A8H7RE00_9FUNG|nr:hypothetical protein INT47_005529 [Mucor saturninus]